MSIKTDSGKAIFDVENIDILFSNNFKIFQNSTTLNNEIHFEKDASFENTFHTSTLTYSNLISVQALNASNLYCTSNVTTEDVTAESCTVRTCDVGNIIINTPSNVVFFTQNPIQFSNIYINESLTVPYVQTNFIFNTTNGTTDDDLLQYGELLLKSFYSNVSSLPTGL